MRLEIRTVCVFHYLTAKFNSKWDGRGLITRVKGRKQALTKEDVISGYLDRATFKGATSCILKQDGQEGISLSDALIIKKHLLSFKFNLGKEKFSDT